MKVPSLKFTRVMAVVVIFMGMIATEIFAQQGKVSQIGEITVLKLPQYELNTGIDYQNAQPMPLPQAISQPPEPFEETVYIHSEGLPGSEPGSRGNGKMSMTSLPKTSESGTEIESNASEGFIPEEFGTSNHPFTTMRVDTSANNQSKNYPYRAAGKLYFKIGTGSYVCSASLIKRGVAVTAAHCVAEFGKNKFYTGFQYHPARYNSTTPYGVWNVSKVYVMSSYFNGSDPCYQSGVVCKNDIAVMVITPKSGTYPGTKTGWFGYGWNGYGFTPKNLALINQLGYPVSHDSGLIMQRTDSQGFKSTTYSDNTIWGSRQTGGSSGGPELVNLGILGVLSGGITVGTEAGSNRVVGVTSWGYNTGTIKQQGASPFLSTNIVPLVNSACTAYPGACK